MEYVKINANDYSVKLLKALHSQGVEIKVNKEKLSYAANHIPHDHVIVIAKGESYEVICGSIGEQAVQRVRLYSKMILKKALKQPVVADRSRIDSSDAAPFNNRSNDRFNNRQGYRDDYGYEGNQYGSRRY